MAEAQGVPSHPEIRTQKMIVSEAEIAALPQKTATNWHEATCLRFRANSWLLFGGLY